MFSVADLIKEKPVKGNYFEPSAYVQGDFELGLLETRQGSRLIALPEVFMEGLFAGLNEEIGQATGLVLYNCGRWWGKNFYRRFVEETSAYYETNLAQMEMAGFLSCFKQCWKVHGWGVIDFDFDYYPQGLISVSTVNSPFAQTAPDNQEFSCQLEAGILSSFFTQLTGEELACIQTSCESMGAKHNTFIIGLETRIEVVKTWLEEESYEHSQILALLSNQSAV